MNQDTNHYFDFGKSMKFFGHFAALSTAVDLNLFEELADEFLSIEEIKEKCCIKIRNRNLMDFLDILFINNHLLREGKGENAKYKVSDNLLLKSNPMNILSLVKMMKRIQKRYEILPETMKTGKFSDSFDIFNELYSNTEDTLAFLKTMSILQLESFKHIAKDYDFTKHKSFIDIGGCLGSFSIEMKQFNPHLEVTTFDKPEIEKYVIDFLKEKDMLDKINVKSGDFFLENFPKVDVIGMGNILHDWNYEKKKLLLKKVHEALNDNGVFIVIEKFIDNERSADDALYMSFNMLVECVDGYNMTRQDLELYAKEVGFKKIDFVLEPHGVEVAFLYKS